VNPASFTVTTTVAVAPRGAGVQPPGGTLAGGRPPKIGTGVFFGPVDTGPGGADVVVEDAADPFEPLEPAQPVIAAIAASTITIPPRVAARRGTPGGVDIGGMIRRAARSVTTRAA
jgi:hypothetical protein